MTDTKPTNVVEALSRIMAELPAIGKDQKSVQGYQYRGIEQITTLLQPLLSKYGVIFAPNVTHWTSDEIVVNGKPWTDQKLTVCYHIYGPGGYEDSLNVTVIGIGRDNSDKGANKAMSQAFKYCLLQVFCIADSKDDSDSEPAYEATHVSPSAPAPAEKRAPVAAPVPAQAGAATPFKAPGGLGEPATPRQKQNIKDLIAQLSSSTGDPVAKIRVEVRKLAGCSFTDMTAGVADELAKKLAHWLENTPAQAELGGGVQ